MLPPIYQTKRFSLRPYQLNDLERFVELNMDEDVKEFMGGGFEAKEEAIALFHKIFEIYKKQDQNRWFWIWGIYENDKLSGHFELKETEHTNNTELEIVYIIHPDARRRGLMTEVLSFCQEKQKEWGKRIIATVDPKNVNSISLLNKWGIINQEIVKDEESDYLKLLLKGIGK